MARAKYIIHHFEEIDEQINTASIPYDYDTKEYPVGIVPLVAVWRSAVCRKSLITTDNKTAFSKSSAQKICR